MQGSLLRRKKYRPAGPTSLKTCRSSLKVVGSHSISYTESPICLTMLISNPGGYEICDLSAQLAWFSLTTKFVSAHASLIASASFSYSISLNSTPGNTSRSSASKRVPSENVSFDSVLMRRACTTSLDSSSWSTFSVTTLANIKFDQSDLDSLDSLSSYTFSVTTLVAM